MSAKVEFGVNLNNREPLIAPDYDLKMLLDLSEIVEASGFDSVWVHDHLTWSDEIHRTHISSGSDDSHAGNASPDFFEAMTSLAYLAGLVRKVRLGIACVVVPCRNPLLAAKQIATLDVLCDGRLDIGVGIASGPVMAGTIGSAERRELIVVGRPMIAAARIQRMTRLFEAHIIAAESTFREVEALVRHRELGSPRLKGLKDRQTLHEILGLCETASTAS